MLAHTMARGNFEQQLHQLQEKLLILSSKVTGNLTLAANILYRADAQEAHRLIAADEAINQAQVQIEQMCLALIATQQPRATDLRLITAVSAIASELERINDYAKGIAKISLSFTPIGLGSEVAILREMGDQLQGMLTGAIDAFIERDVPQACAIHAADQAIDILYQQIQRELLAYLMTHVEVMENATKLMWAAHNYERAGDRIGNICERVVFLVTGEIIELPYDEWLMQITPEVSYVSPPD
ncbi:MAG: phosphate signaling complex protein PhoU [Chloroflexota bacterium]